MGAPEKKFVAGAISVGIWRNQTKLSNGQDIVYTTVQLDRRYKDKNGNWVSSNTLRENDIPKALFVLNKAYEYILTGNKETDTKEEVEEIIM